MKFNLKSRNTIALLVLLLSCLPLNGQEPSYTIYNIENGAPSNEIYSLLKDTAGYLWIGSDAGVYRFNGLTYQHYENPELMARSATGLTQTKSGKIYGYNFKGQLFYIHNNALHVIKGWEGALNGLAIDDENKIWISSQKGAFYIDDENQMIHKHTSKLHKYTNEDDVFTSCIRRNNKGTIYYQNGTSIIERALNGKEISMEIHPSFHGAPIIISNSSGEPWLFSLTEAKVFHKKYGKWEHYTDMRLLDLLQDRKPTTAIEIDDHLWISTHTGVIRFNYRTGDAELFYPSIAFSGCIKDQEGNYWFSTLYHGLLKIPSIEIRTWNNRTSLSTIEQFSQVVFSKNNIYAASTRGEILSLQSPSNISIPKHDLQADIGMLYYDSIDACVYFNKLSYIFQLKNGTITRVNHFARSIKAMLHNHHGYFLLSSQGIYFTNNIAENLVDENRIADGWYREICASASRDTFYVASNEGLLVLALKDGQWQFIRTYLPGKQIISVSYDSSSQKVYFLTFNGEIQCIDKNGTRSDIATNLAEYRPVHLLTHQQQVYVSTIQGVLEVDLKTRKRTMMSAYNGLPSNNIRHLAIRNDTCWAASGKGLIAIPLQTFDKKMAHSVLHEKEVRINHEIIPIIENQTLLHDDLLTIVVDGISYSSNGDFQLAYKIIDHTDWIYIPGSISKLEIPRLPSGKIHLMVKLVDHNNLDSINTLHYRFRVIPPYWQRWWFNLLLIGIIGFIAYFIFLWRLTVIRNKQYRTLRQLKLENELRLTQQNALKAQMNPHFLFNVLNSIKAFIYANDKINAARYLSDFSKLVRNILELSSLSEVSLEKELNALRVYIELEAMLLQDDFSYSIEISTDIHTANLQIPALIIQPYVENAFKHGLRHKKGPKELKLTVNYNEENHIIEIQIKDNGVGRAKSESINLSNPTQHQSFATSAIEKRIHLLNHEQKNVIGVEIIDNFEEQTPQGTTVIIRIHV